MDHLIEAYLLIEQPRQRLGHWTQTLAALDSPMAPALAHVTALYDPTSDQALLALRYDELALGPQRLQFVVEVALLAEVGMIQPNELSEVERAVSDRATRAVRARGVDRAQCDRRADRARAPRSRAADRQAAATAGASVQPRGDTADPVLLVAAKGTRNDLEKQSADALNPVDASPCRRAQQSPADRGDRAEGSAAPGHRDARDGRRGQPAASAADQEDARAVADRCRQRARICRPGSRR